MQNYWRMFPITITNVAIFEQDQKSIDAIGSVTRLLPTLDVKYNLLSSIGPGHIHVNSKSLNIKVNL